MNRSITLLIALTVLGGVAGCNGPEKREIPATQAPAARATASAEPAAAPTVAPVTTGEPTTTLAAGELPTPEDFEEEAQERLASANLEVELDALEQEIGQ